MSSKSLLDSRRVGELGLRMCRALPPKGGYLLADFIAARQAGRKNSPLVKAIRANQWVIRGKNLGSEELDRAAGEVLRHTMRAFYLFFHYFENVSWMKDFVVLDEELARLNSISQLKHRGLIILGVHMCYFDLALMGLVYHGLQTIALSLPQTTPAIEWQHELRRRSGLDIVPASIHNLRRVIQRLEGGGTIATGIDRPMGEVKVKPEFFGYPSHAPVHYIQLALKAQTPVKVLVPVLENDGRIHILMAPEIEMQHFPDRQEELLVNAKQVLDITAGFIARYPEQWGMSWPVWPDILERVP